MQRAASKRERDLWQKAGMHDRFSVSGRRSIRGFFQCPVKLYMPNLNFACILSCDAIRLDFPAVDNIKHNRQT